MATSVCERTFRQIWYGDNVFEVENETSLLCSTVNWSTYVSGRRRYLLALFFFEDLIISGMWVSAATWMAHSMLGAARRGQGRLLVRLDLEE